MHALRLPIAFTALLCMVYPATCPGDTVRGEVSVVARARDILGDDATAWFGSALDPDEVNEWALYVPESYDPESPAGLLVFISPGDSGRMPGRYRQVLDDNNLIWIGANQSGNRVRVGRRISLALLATVIADGKYRIDASRVYVSGFSGGGRTASMLAPEYAQLFTGAIYICGADFWDRRKPKQLDRVRDNRYVFLTGSKDFNRSETRRVHLAYRRADVDNIMLLEVAGMDHRMPPPEDLAQAITFLDE